MLARLLAIAALAAAMPLADQEQGLEKRGSGGSCTGGPWASDAIVIPAAAKGTPFCESGWSTTSFVPVVGVQAWTSGYYCQGIQFTYADGTVGPIIGRSTNEYPVRTLDVNYATGDKFTSAVMYGPANSGVLAHLELRTAAGGKLNCGESVYEYAPAEHAQDVASGILMGAQGAINTKIDSIGFFFLRSAVTNVDLSNLKFPNGPTGSTGINPQTLANGHYFNSQATQNSTWTFTDAKAVATTQTFTQASTNTYTNTVTFSVTASIPFISALSVTAGTSFAWAYAQMSSDAVATADTTTVTWGQSGTLAPGHGVDCSAIVGEGAGTYPYTSDVTLGLADGTSFSFQEAGSLKFSDVSQAIVEVTDANTP